MKTYAPRKDANDAALTKLARQCGAYVIHAEPGQGFDWLLFHRGRVLIVEIKDGTKPASHRQLTPKEREVQSICQAHNVKYNIILNERDLIALLEQE